MTRRIGFFQIAIGAFLSALVAGCGTTPRERYNAAALTFDATSVGLAVYQAARPMPATEWAQIQQWETTAALRLAESNAWLVNNPTLADVPGGPFPPLAPANIALDILRTKLHTLNGVIIVPTSPAPATRPG